MISVGDESRARGVPLPNQNECGAPAIVEIVNGASTRDAPLWLQHQVTLQSPDPYRNLTRAKCNPVALRVPR